MQALKVTFKLASPLFLDSEYPIHLDALLAFALVQELEDKGDDDCWAKADEALSPVLARSVGEEWVWKASKLFMSPVSSILLSNQIRRSDPEMYFDDFHSESNPSGVWVSGFMKSGADRLINPDTFKINTAKGQQKTNKESKKPKKDTSPPKPLASGEAPVRATITTTVIPRGKIKTK